MTTSQAIPARPSLPARFAIGLTFGLALTLLGLARAGSPVGRPVPEPSGEGVAHVLGADEPGDPRIPLALE